MTTESTIAPTSAAGLTPRRVATIIIGAGQTGLATAYHLGRAGQECVVLHGDARVGDQWRNRYDSLRLNTPALRDSLPGTPFPAAPYSFPTGREMGDYLERYVAEHGIDVRHATEVTRVDRLGDGTHLVTSYDEAFHCDNVVVATGGEHHPRVPDVSRLLDPGIRQLHSSAYRNPGQLLPGPALVVGSGQSGADVALELAGAGHEVWLSGKVNGEPPVTPGTRRSRLMFPILWFVANHVLTTRTPIGRKLQPVIRTHGTPLLRVKRADLDAAGVHRVESRTTGAVDGLPQLDDGTVLDVANVVWCTGFRQEFGFIHPSVTGEDGWPRDEGGIVPESPGLYFMGLLFQRGFYSMLIGGAGRDAKYIARHIVTRMRSAAPA
jgi:putative flavoprotein involved in K+ transport